MNSPLNILLAEDDAEDKDFFIDALRKLDLAHKVSWAKNDTELFQYLSEAASIDLVIIDLDMPGKSGKEILREIKANEKYRRLPVIILTVSKHSNDVDEVYKEGAHYYAVKPYSQVNYIETLKRIFDIDWKVPQPVPPKNQFVINLAFV